jgi:hypothetical protein
MKYAKARYSKFKHPHLLQVLVGNGSSHRVQASG